ncbi:MAG: hypothetical protein LC791_17235 [Acidobacteria bacterium]|nr:hypothetical protein [Acidobacteriota bacterium]
MARPLLLLLVLAAGVAATLGFDAAIAHPRVTTALTWKSDISPILERRCLSCHRAGGIAPMSFESYESARPWARAVREEILERRMPPTALRSGTMLYENARTLSLGEMELLAAWVDGGAPSGEEPWVTGVPAPPTTVAAPSVTPAADWPIRLDGKAVTEQLSPLTHRVQFVVPAGWIGAWTLDTGGLPARSARLTYPDGAVLGTWTPDEPPVRYADNVGIGIDRPTTITAEFTLASAADADERARARPQLRLAPRKDVRSRVLRRTMREASPVEEARSLLALRLELADRDATADVIVERKNGERVFLMAMAPPGVPDPISYRLRTPLVLRAGDVIRVNSTASFILDVEEMRAVRGSPKAGEP